MKLLQSKTDHMPADAARYVMVLVFGVSFLLLSSIEFLDAIAIVAVVAIQVFLGGLIWRKIRGAAPIEVVEFLGMGGAVGFSLAIISSQIFRETLPRSIAWLVLLVAVYGLCVFVKSASVGDATPVAETENKSKPEYPLLVIFCGTLVALSTSWYWLIPTALVCTGAIVWLLLRETVRLFSAKTYLVYKVALLPLGFYALQVLIDLTRVETIRNPNWWSLRFGVLQDPDVVFNESMVNSVQKFGSSDNIFFAGYPLQYHWLSFAWEATLESLRDLAPFVVSGIAGPAVVMFLIMALVYTLARQLCDSTFSPPATVAVIAMMCSGPIPLFRVLNPYSFSYNFSLIFVFAILILLSAIEQEFSFLNVLFFSLFVFVAVGSKVSNAAGIAIGLISIFVSASIHREGIRKAVLLGCSAALAVATFWLFAYRVPGVTGGSTIRLDFGEIFIQKANYSWSSNMNVLIFGFIATFAMTVYPLTGLLLWVSVSSKARSVAGIFALGTGFSFIFLSVLLADDLESSSYLLGAGLAVLTPISLRNLFSSATKSSPSRLLVIFVAISIGFMSAFGWNRFYSDLGTDQTSNQITQSLILSAPILVALFFAIFVFVSSHRVKFAAAGFSIVLVSTSAGSFIANAGSFYSAGVASKSGSDEVAEPIIGSIEYRELLTWLKVNSAQQDQVATNRQCLEVRVNPKECLALWSLTSAISDRQNLVEGLYPPNSENENEERDRRMSIVIEFVENPSDEDRDSLVEYGVKWVVADHAITNTRDWQPFATERFKNPAGSILELNP